jgi:hypothetical protein
MIPTTTISPLRSTPTPLSRIRIARKRRLLLRRSLSRRLTLTTRLRLRAIHTILLFRARRSGSIPRRPSPFIPLWPILRRCREPFVAAAVARFDVVVCSALELVEEKGALEAHFHYRPVEPRASELGLVVGLLDGREAPFQRDAFAVVRHFDARREGCAGGGMFCVVVSFEVLEIVGWWMST